MFPEVVDSGTEQTKKTQEKKAIDGAEVACPKNSPLQACRNMKTGCPGDKDKCGSMVPKKRDPPKDDNAGGDTNGGDNGPAAEKDDSGISSTIWIIIAVAAVVIIGFTLYCVRRSKLRQDGHQSPQDDLGPQHNESEIEPNHTSSSQGMDMHQMNETSMGHSYDRVGA